MRCLLRCLRGLRPCVLVRSSCLAVLRFRACLMRPLFRLGVRHFRRQNRPSVRWMKPVDRWSAPLRCWRLPDISSIA